jgi:hypothetical protein
LDIDEDQKRAVSGMPKLGLLLLPRVRRVDTRALPETSAGLTMLSRDRYLMMPY